MKFSGVLGGLLVAAVSVWASSDVQNSDAAQWSGRDVYLILHNSPWTKSVKVSRSEKNVFNNNPSGGSVPSNTGSAGSTPGRMGGMGGGMGRRGGGTYSSGPRSGSSGGNSSGSSNSSAEVLIQWQSALAVRLAAAKDAGEDASAVAGQPSNEYIVAVIGLPLADVGGHGPGLDSGETDQEGTERIANRLKSGTALLRPGHEPLAPSSIQFDQGKDGRMLFHFPKTDAITLKDKTVEFRITATGTKVEKKFVLKEMEYQGRLEL